MEIKLKIICNFTSIGLAEVMNSNCDKKSTAVHVLLEIQSKETSQSVFLLHLEIDHLQCFLTSESHPAPG